MIRNRHSSTPGASGTSAGGHAGLGSFTDRGSMTNPGMSSTTNSLDEMGNQSGDEDSTATNEELAEQVKRNNNNG